MKLRIGRWLMGLAALLMFAGVVTPPQATAADTHVAVVIGHNEHHRYAHRHYYRHHYVVYYRHGRRYRVYR